MPTEAKKAAVAELREDLSQAKATIVADYRGLTVSEISAVRRVLRGEGIKYRVVKNRLAKIAAQEAGNAELVSLLQGPSALAIGSGDEVALARSFLDAVRPFKTVTVRGAVLGGKLVDASSVSRLATLPSREVLLGQLAGGMAAPLANLASLLAAPLRNLGYALTQLIEKKSADAPKAEAPVAEAVAAPAETEAPAEAPEAEAPAEAPEAEALAGAPEAEAPADAPEAEAVAEAPEAETPAEATAETSDEPVADSEPAAETKD